MTEKNVKKALVILALIIATGLTAEANNFYKGVVGSVSREEVIVSLTEIVRLFDEHADQMGGAGFLYGVKSIFKTLFSDSHRDMLQNYLLRTPVYILRASGISEQDPALGRVFVRFCRMMPNTYDTYQSCREKIQRCVRAIFPGKSDRFYEDIMDKMRKETGARWL